MRQDDEGTATRRLHDDGEKLGIHGAERRVPRRLGHPDIVVALLALQRSSVHVAELAGAHHAERHVCTCSAITKRGTDDERATGVAERSAGGRRSCAGPSVAIILINYRRTRVRDTGVGVAWNIPALYK